MRVIDRLISTLGDPSRTAEYAEASARRPLLLYELGVLDYLYSQADHEEDADALVRLDGEIEATEFDLGLGA